MKDYARTLYEALSSVQKYNLTDPNLVQLLWIKDKLATSLEVSRVVLEFPYGVDRRLVSLWRYFFRIMWIENVVAWWEIYQYDGAYQSKLRVRKVVAIGATIRKVMLCGEGRWTGRRVKGVLGCITWQATQVWLLPCIDRSVQVWAVQASQPNLAWQLTWLVPSHSLSLVACPSQFHTYSLYHYNIFCHR